MTMRRGRQRRSWQHVIREETWNSEEISVNTDHLNIGQDIDLCRERQKRRVRAFPGYFGRDIDLRQARQERQIRRLRSKYRLIGKCQACNRDTMKCCTNLPCHHMTSCQYCQADIRQCPQCHCVITGTRPVMDLTATFLF